MKSFEVGKIYKDMENVANGNKLFQKYYIVLKRTAKYVWIKQIIESITYDWYCSLRSTTYHYVNGSKILKCKINYTQDLSKNQMIEFVVKDALYHTVSLSPIETNCLKLEEENK